MSGPAGKKVKKLKIKVQEYFFSFSRTRRQIFMRSDTLQNHFTYHALRDVERLPRQNHGKPGKPGKIRKTEKLAPKTQKPEPKL